MKRWPLVLLLVMLLGAAALVSAQEEESGLVPEGEGIPLTVYPIHEISGTWKPVQLEPLAEEPEIGIPGSDLCVDAPEIEFPGGGGLTDTRAMTRSSDDPILSCMWGRPQDPAGFRTMWYKVTPEESGLLRVFTSGSTYDTVLAVYSSDQEDACVNLAQLSCSDDSSFLLSQVTQLVLSGHTYFIEVADWNIEAPGETLASVSAVLEPINEWQPVTTLDPARSRHATVINGNTAILIGGQIYNAQNIPDLLNVTQSYNLITGVWTELAPMCLPGKPCGTGYSNTAAALINGKVYLPSGYVGNVDEYDGTHWVYDIASNRWSKANNDIWNSKPPTVYGAAVVEGTGLLEKYYYSGGLIGPMPLEGEVNDDAWSASPAMDIYLPASNSWFVNSVPPMPVGRFGHVAAKQGIRDTNGNIQTHICVMSGLGKSESGGPILITDGICYNTVSGGWDRNLPSLNHPRYFAGSAVDPDGNWYVFGGTDQNGFAVPSTEVFNRQKNEWILLDTRFDLGDTSVVPFRPARSWPRGDFWGRYLFAFGGERRTENGPFTLNLVSRAKFPPLVSAAPKNPVYLPLSFNRDAGQSRNSTFASAVPIPVNQRISSEFVQADDFADVFYTNVPANQPLSVQLRDIPAGADYDLFVYNDNKGLLGFSALPGNNDETVNLSLPPRLIYIVVERVLPVPGSTPIFEPYSLLVQR